MVAGLRTGGPHLSIGLLTADMLSLGSELRLLESVGAEIVHFDVMDGVFCPALTVGPTFVKAMRTSLLKDVHLMVTNPLDKVTDFVEAGADIVVFHLEGAPQPHRVLQVLGQATNVNDADRGIVRGVALNPSTPLEVLEPLIDDLELVLLLAINPGWGEQKFIDATERRLAAVSDMLGGASRNILLAVDGGVTRDNIARVAAMGADIVVTGSAVFDGRAAEQNALLMLKEAKTASRQVGGGHD
jgi:ribulose-phosphate 3-epimerase